MIRRTVISCRQNQKPAIPLVLKNGVLKNDHNRPQDENPRMNVICLPMLRLAVRVESIRNYND
jgi:hypothetical protein